VSKTRSTAWGGLYYQVVLIQYLLPKEIEMEDEEDTYCCYNCEYVDSETGEDYGSEED